MFYQGRGNLYLQEIVADENGVETLLAAITLCTDSLALQMSTESGTHVNKCTAVDVEDARFTKKNSAALSIAIADVRDNIFALGALGIVNVGGAPGTVSDEVLPGDLADGDVWFLGGKTRHRAITGLTITGMSLNTDYTLDAASGKVTFIGDQSATPAPTASYGYTDPQYVSMFTGGTKNYMGSYEFINKQNSNRPGSLELYKVRFDPADNLDFQSDDLQIMSLKGSALADTTREDDTELGQFGRRIL